MENSHIRVLVLRENWLGCTGLSAFNAMLRAGCRAESISETDFIPLQYRSFIMRATAKLLRPFAVQEFNRELLRMNAALKPHLFLAVKGQFIQAETLRAMRTAGTRLYCFFPDLSFTAFGAYLAASAKEYDWLFTTKSFGPRDLKERLGVENSSYLPHAYDRDVHRPRSLSAEDSARYGCDISFIGKHSPAKAKILEDLVRLRPQINLKVWGNQWERLAPDSPLRKFVEFRAANGTEYATAISASRINLGLLQEAIPGASSGDQITSRTFHIPGAGGLMLHERTEDLLKIFREDEHCVCFNGVEELNKKIGDLLADPARCERISATGRALVESAHSWNHRAQAILDHFRREKTGNGPASRK